MRTTVSLAVLAAFLGRPAAATPQETPATPGEKRVAKPSPQPPDPAPRTGSVRATAPRAGDAANAGVLKGCRAVDVRSGEARLALADGSVRTLRPGDGVGEHTVTSIEPGRLVLRRGTTAAGRSAGGLVVVSFDDHGRSRVRVYMETDPTARLAPEVR